MNRGVLLKNNLTILYLVVSSICRSFLAASRVNNNLVSLIDQFLIRHGEVVTAVECQDPIFPWHVGNSLFVIRRLFLHLIQHFDGRTILEIFAQCKRPDILTHLVKAIISVLSEIALLKDQDFSNVYGFVVEGLRLGLNQNININKYNFLFLKAKLESSRSL
jgi:hypothetical protein